jgi:arylsulfatase A-like enzyme
MATLFSGLHHSMLHWTPGKGGKPTLGDDRRPRLPELLQTAGVQTASVRTVTMMHPRQGIVRGFDEEFRRDKLDGDERTLSHQVADKVIERLRRQGPEPLFFYTHLMDPHDPYETYGKPAASPFAAYLMEVSVADANVGRIRRAIAELGLRHRTALIIGADHGEGFGEHRIFTHGKAIYDVMVRVPSTRVLLMEKPSHKAMLFGDGLKVMKRSGAFELYDVLRDPQENDNLWDQLGDEGPRRLALLDAYVKAHSKSRADFDRED